MLKLQKHKILIIMPESLPVMAIAVYNPPSI